MKKKLDTPEEKKHAELRDAIIKERPQEWDHIQKERQKIREARAEVALAEAEMNPTDTCLLYTSPSPRDGLLSRMPSSA